MENIVWAVTPIVETMIWQEQEGYAHHYAYLPKKKKKKKNPTQQQIKFVVNLFF